MPMPPSGSAPRLPSADQMTELESCLAPLHGPLASADLCQICSQINRNALRRGRDEVRAKQLVVDADLHWDKRESNRERERERERDKDRERERERGKKRRKPSDAY